MEKINQNKIKPNEKKLNRFVSKFGIDEIAVPLVMDICEGIANVDDSFRYRIYKNVSDGGVGFILCIFDDDEDRLHKRSLLVRNYLAKEGFDVYYHIDKLSKDNVSG